MYILPHTSSERAHTTPLPWVNTFRCVRQKEILRYIRQWPGSMCVCCKEIWLSSCKWLSRRDGRNMAKFRPRWMCPKKWVIGLARPNYVRVVMVSICSFHLDLTLFSTLLFFFSFSLSLPRFVVTFFMKPFILWHDARIHVLSIMDLPVWCLYAMPHRTVVVDNAYFLPTHSLSPSTHSLNVREREVSLQHTPVPARVLSSFVLWITRKNTVTFVVW